MFGLSDVGCVRKNNEDCFCIDEHFGFCLLADGMGGHGYGEVAAAIAVQASHGFLVTSRDLFDITWPFGYDHHRSLDENRLMNAIQLANRRIWCAVKEQPKYAGMGSTLVAAAVNNERFVIGSVGDSRAYLLRNGELHQLSTDDSWVGHMLRKGALTEQDAKVHAMRNVLTQAAGAHYDLNVHTLEQPMIDGDVLLLATDGVYGQVDAATLRSILYSHENSQAAAKHLVAAALEAGAPDNATCIVVRRRPGLSL
jgi:protein phosphatase